MNWIEVCGGGTLGAEDRGQLRGSQGADGGELIGTDGPVTRSKALELREKYTGRRLSGDTLEKVLNEHAAEGWQLKLLTRAGGRPTQ